LRREIGAARRTLDRRARNTADEQERAALAASSAKLRDLGEAKRPTALEVATALANAAAELERAVGAARLGPFNGYLCALEAHLDRLNALSQAIHARDALGEAPAPKRAAGARPARRTRGGLDRATGAAMPRGARRGVETGAGPLSTSTDFASLKDEYQTLWDGCTVREGCEGNVAYYVKRLERNRSVYEAVGQELGIPWGFVGVIHAMECGFDFSAHLHNGDPLTARTIQVPKGRPAAGTPPFTWRESAVDALTMKKLDRVQDWSAPSMLHLLERYNGLGYRKRGLPSPYLWSFSNHYEKGKFVKDGVYDPNAVSKQCGAAVMLRAVLEA
jgi:lysozyme family protein